jgi:hypothetical protein
MIEVFVESIRVNMTNYKRVVMLKEKAGDRYLPIWIGHYEADAIAIPMQKVPTTRPLTHDMLVSTIAQLGGRCTHAAISRLENETFYATLVADQGGRHVEIDCRPSDAISTAIRVRVPIFVDDEVMDRAAMVLPPTEVEPPAEDGGAGAIAQAESIVDAATGAATGVSSAEAEGSAGEPADSDAADDPAATAPYWPGAEPAAGPAPAPFDALGSVSEPVLAALQWTAREAARRGRPLIGPGDLLLGLLRQDRASANRVLADLSVQVEELRTLVQRELGRDVPPVALTPAAQAVLARAIEEAGRLDEGTVGAEHVLLALAGESEGSVPVALGQLGVSLASIRRQIAVLLAQASSQDDPPDQPRPPE